jgi:tRNA(adenine34) deaminase
VTIAAAHPAPPAVPGEGIRRQARRAQPVLVAIPEATDKTMMTRCIELSRTAVGKGEYPFATIIACDGQVVAESINTTIRDSDVTRHAEIIALSQAQQAIGREQLRRATLYSNIEPCAMCAYCIREAWIGRVVYAMGSPVMGGHSKWNILRDRDLSDRLPGVFGGVPEVVSGVMVEEAQRAWRDWNPFAWQVIKLRGLLATPPLEQGVQLQPASGCSLWRHFHMLFMRRSRSRNEPDVFRCPAAISDLGPPASE